MPDSSRFPSSKIGALMASPADIVKHFGKGAPDTESGDGKVDREYFFRPVGGSPHVWIGVYCYEATSLYDRDLPTPAEFWDGMAREQFSVAGNDRARGLVAPFVEWIIARLAEPVRDRPLPLAVDSVEVPALDEKGTPTTVQVKRVPAGGIMIHLAHDPDGPVVLDREQAERFREVLGKYLEAKQ